MTDSVDPSEHMIRREKRVPSFATDVQHTLSQNKSLHQSGAAGDESNALDPCTVSRNPSGNVVVPCYSKCC